MFRRQRGAWGPERRVAFAAVPAVIGLGVLLLTGDPPDPGTSRLRTSQAASSPVRDPAPTTTTMAGPISLAGPDLAPTTTGLPLVGTSVAEAPGAVPRVEGPATTTTTTTVGAGPTGPTGATGLSSTTTTARTTDPPIEPAAAATTTTTTPTTAAGARTGPTRTPGVEAEIVPLTNRDRLAGGLGALARNGCLDAAASGYAEQLARSGVLAHNPGAGAAVTDCRPGATWGDNIGSAGPCDAALLEASWMASPGHRRNILTGSFQLIGVGAWTDGSGTCWAQVLFSS